MDEDVQEVPMDSFFVPGFKDAGSFSQAALRSILMATKSANDLPAPGDDFDYYSTFPAFREVLFHKRQKILSLMSDLIQSHGIREKFQGRESEEKFDLLVDANDVILENVSNYLDEASGVKKSEEELVLAVKPPSSINTSWNKKQYSASPQTLKLLTAKNVSRPQLSFRDKIDNSNSIFVPIIKEKPNSIKPLAIMVEHDGDQEEFCHPYEWEIEKFNPSEEILEVVEPILPKPVEETPLIVVKTEEQLKELSVELKAQKEFAVDLEHHSYRSFQGFSCLMQISTREKDYIVDVLELRSELHLLNDAFTDPKITKVLHGADMDVQWLQRDFGIYIVNLFDTGQAARVLQFAHLSLSYLLKHYCKLEVDKRFQLADWRIRPLPAEMIKYAREDTHYLLYVYDCMKNDLIKNGNEMKNLLRSTFDRSKVICAKKYQKPLFSEDKYLELYKKSKKILNPKQLYCLKELYSWRDRIARENDESLHYVLPNHMLLQIASALPREQQGILACCNPVPPLVKQQLNELHTIVLKANESSLKQLEKLELEQKANTPRVNNHLDLGSIIHCPHDIHHLEDKKGEAFNQSGTTENLLPLITKSSSSSSLLKKKPTLSALFHKTPKKVKSTSDSQEESVSEKVMGLIKKLISPFERYKVTEELQLKEAEKKTSKKQKPETDPKQVQDVLEQPEVIEDAIDLESSVVIVETNSAVETSAINTSTEFSKSTPLRKRMRNRKRKQKPEPDIALIVTPESSNLPPNKKSRTPEVVTVDDESFQPYDYSQSDYNAFSAKKNTKDKSKQGKQGANYQTPRPFFGRKRKNVQQATFSTESTSGGKSKNPNSRWPKNK